MRKGESAATTSAIAQLINEGLQKLPTFEGKFVYRAIEISEKDLPNFLAKYKKGAVTEWGDFTSAGGSVGSSFAKKTKNNVLFEIEQKSARDISDLADGIKNREMERPEVLLENGAKIESTRSPFFQESKGRWILTVREL